MSHEVIALPADRGWLAPLFPVTIQGVGCANIWVRCRCGPQNPMQKLQDPGLIEASAELAKASCIHDEMMAEVVK